MKNFKLYLVRGVFSLSLFVIAAGFGAFLYSAAEGEKNSLVIVERNAIEITLRSVSENLSYVCLASAEYDQLYLPRDFQCSQCTMDRASRRLILSGWKKHSILLVARAENRLNVQRVNLAAFQRMQPRTSYKSISYKPELMASHAQCSRKQTASARCIPFGRSCLFVFLKEEL